MRRKLLTALTAALVVSCVSGVGIATASSPARALADVARSTTFVGVPSSMCPAPTNGAQYNGPAVQGGRRTVALTFDDGPGGSTQAIIDILERYHVRATFFNVGTGEATRPYLVREEAKDGFLLGDHTVDHKDLELLSASGQAAELDGVIHEQRVLVHSSPCVFRPPYGAWNATSLQLANERRMTLWMWNNSGADWMARGSGSSYWINRIVSLAEGEGINEQHAVILLHNQPILMPATVAALPQIISFFQRHGYAFEDLLGRIGPPGSCGTSATPPRVPATYLRSGVTLASGATKDTPGDQIALAMGADGDLKLKLATGRVVWETKTAGHVGATASMETTGNFVVRSTTSHVLWSSGTSGHAGAVLSVRADGSLEVVQGSNVLWTSHSAVSQLLPGERLKPNWRLTSPNGRCRLIQQSSGALTLRDADGQVLWSTGTTHAAGADAVLLTNGRLGIFTPTRQNLWQSWTGGRPDSRLRVTNQGQLVLSSSKGETLWETP